MHLRHAFAFVHLRSCICVRAFAFMHLRSRLKENIEFRRLDWMHPDAVGYDLVVGADVLYNPQMVDPLVNAALKAIKASGRVLISYYARDLTLIDLLQAAARKRGANCVGLDTSAIEGISARCTIFELMFE